MDKLYNDNLKKEYIDKYEYHLHYNKAEQEYLATVSEFKNLSVFAKTKIKTLKELKNIVHNVLFYYQENKLSFPIPKYILEGR